MNKNVLLIVEGKVSEQNIFHGVFSKYGFNVVVCEKPLTIENIGQFEKIEYKLNNNNIVIIQGPRNRIHDFLLLFNENEMSIEKIFEYPYAFFTGIFLIYDVDHNDNDDIEKMYKKFSDESTGMLLLSSPCIEVIADYNRNREVEKYSHLSEYKTDINNYYQGLTEEHIINNFEELMLYFLDKNQKELKSNNIMEHPSLIVEKINNFNERVNFKDKDKSYVIYRYFSTVVYTAIAYANGLTKEINNYSILRKFLLNKKKLKI